jgi:hypothetical protein
MSASAKAIAACRNVGAAAADPSVNSNVRPSSTRSTGRGEAGGRRTLAARDTSRRSPAPAKRPANNAAIHSMMIEPVTVSAAMAAYVH